MWENQFNDFLKYLFYFLTAIVAIISTFFKVRKTDGELNRTSIVLIGITILLCILSFGIVCNESVTRTKQEQQDITKQVRDSLQHLRDSLEAKKNTDSILIKSTKTLDSVNKSLTEIRELQQISSNIDKATQNTLIAQGTLLLSTDSLLKNQIQNNNQITGGDTYGFIYFIELPDINSQDFMKPGPIKRKFHFGLLNKGIFPLYDNGITISEPIKWVLYNNRDYNYYKVDRLNPPHKSNNSSIWWLDNRSILDDETIIMFEISIYSRNDEFNQTTIFKKIKRPVSNFERWTEATRVSSLNKKKYVYEFIDPEFPKDAQGKVEWELYKAVEYYHKTKK
jgi:hypothetical protein